MKEGSKNSYLEKKIFKSGQIREIYNLKHSAGIGSIDEEGNFKHKCKRTSSQALTKKKLSFTRTELIARPTQAELFVRDRTRSNGGSLRRRSCDFRGTSL